MASKCSSSCWTGVRAVDDGEAVPDARAGSEQRRSSRVLPEKRVKCDSAALGACEVTHRTDTASLESRSLLDGRTVAILAWTTRPDVSDLLEADQAGLRSLTRTPAS